MKTPRAPAPLGVHCWTDVAWWDQVRGVFNEASLLPHPSLPRPPPPLLGLSSELHVARLPTASCDKPSCPLTTSFLMLAGKTRAATASVYVRARETRAQMHTCSHTGFKGNIIQEEEEFPNDQTQAAWWVFASPRLCCLSVFISEVRHCFCLSFTSCCSLFFVLIFIFLSILASVFLFAQKAFRCNFPSCFTFFKINYSVSVSFLVNLSCFKVFFLFF